MGRKSESGAVGLVDGSPIAASDGESVVSTSHQCSRLGE